MNLLDAYNLMHEGTIAFSRAERRGLRVDVEYCEKKRDHLNRKIAHLYKKLGETGLGQKWYKVFKNKTNYNSDDQMRYILYKVYQKPPPAYTDKGHPAVNADALKKLSMDMPELERFIEIRRLDKIKDVLEGFLREQVNGVIHPFFNLHTAVTFRSSSDRPNFQNIPKRDPEMMKICRRALFPPEGFQLLEVDYGALEVAIAACYCQDPTLLAYLNDPESDMHGDMADQIFMLDNYRESIEQAGSMKAIKEFKVLRDATKNGFVFPQFYGDYYGNNAQAMACEWGGLPKGKWKHGQGIPMPNGKSLSDHLISKGIKSYREFENYLEAIERDFWERRFKVYKKWRDEWFKEYQERTEFDMLTGFKCRGLMKRNEVINAPVQGSAFHCLLQANIDVEKEAENWYSKPIGQIHDALVMYLWPPEKDQVLQRVKEISTVELPQKWDWITAPLTVEAEMAPVDASWDKTEGVEI